LEENTKASFDQSFFEHLQQIAREGVHKAARGFSGMLGQALSVSHFDIGWIPVTDIPNVLGGPEIEAAGIYLRSEGDFTGQIMLIVPLAKAYELVDLLMDNPVGTTTQLGSMERSALAEVGNITGTFFLSVVENTTGHVARPTPPAVIVDMVGAIMDIIIAATGSARDQVLLFKSGFTCGSREVPANFWVIPDPNTIVTFSTGG
jgi:chemotaxis protein CheC